jgi:hypothetical protein
MAGPNPQDRLRPKDRDQPPAVQKLTVPLTIKLVQGWTF